MSNKYGFDKKEFQEIVMVGYALRGVLEESENGEKEQVEGLIKALRKTVDEHDIGDMTMIASFLLLTDLIKAGE